MIYNQKEKKTRKKERKKRTTAVFCNTLKNILRIIVNFEIV